MIVVRLARRLASGFASSSNDETSDIVFDDNSGKLKRIIVQVKSDGVKRGNITTLKGDMERENAEIGLFITLKPPTSSDSARGCVGRRLCA